MPRSAANKSEENCTNGDKDDDRRMGERRTRETAAAAAADFSRTINVSLIYRLVVTARQNVAQHFLYIWKHNTTPCNTYSLRPTTSGCTARFMCHTAEWIELVCWYRDYPRVIIHCVIREFRYLEKWQYFLLQPCPTLSTRPVCFCFSPPDVDHRKCCRLKSTIAGLSYWAPTLVYNTANVTHSVARFAYHSRDVSHSQANNT